MPLPIQCREDFQQLAQMAALMTDAHSCAIFLPTELVTTHPHATSLQHSRKSDSERSLPFRLPQTSKLPQETTIDLPTGSIDLVAIHSYAKLVRDCRIQVGSGLLGWVADQGRPIHLTPFEVGSAAIGIYIDQEPIRSLVAVPIIVGPTDQSAERSPSGVLMCDSLNPQAFTNGHIKLLEQVASHAKRLLFWVQSVSQVTHVEASWDFFKHKTAELGGAIGHTSVEILRLTAGPFLDLQQSAGLSAAVQLTEQFLRLAQQALPPHFPLVRLPNGDMLIAVDNMMSSFFQQKLHSLANHLHTSQKPFVIAIERYSAKLGPNGQCNLDLTLQQQPLTVKTSSNIGGTRG
jgi:hypothetical protein